MLALILLGAVVTALAFFRGWFSWTSDDSWPVWQSIFTNFGVGILSAAALLLCEPLLRKVVTDTVSHAAAGVRDELRGEVESQIDDRLAPLSERIDSLYETRFANQSKALDNLAQDFTYERVKRAFEEAARVGALSGTSWKFRRTKNQESFVLACAGVRLTPRGCPTTGRFAAPLQTPKCI